MKPTGAHTHPHGSSLPELIALIVLVIAGAPVALSVLAILLHFVLIITAAFLAAAITALSAFIAYQLRHHRNQLPGQLSTRPTPAQAHTAPGRAAITQPARSTVHLHLHGVTAQDVADALTNPVITSTQDRG